MKENNNYSTNLDISVNSLSSDSGESYRRLNQTKKKKNTAKRIIKVILMLFAMYSAISIAERIIIYCYGDVYMKNVLEERYNDTFEYIGHVGYGDYGFKCGSMPEEEILVKVYTKNYSFWNDKQWEDNYLNLKYDAQAEDELLRIVEQAFGEGAIVDINCYKELKVPGYSSIKCTSLTDFMRYGLRYGNIDIIVVCPLSEKDEKLEHFLSILEERDYNIGHFFFYVYESEIGDFSNDVQPDAIYINAAYHDFISIDENFEIKED